MTTLTDLLMKEKFGNKNPNPIYSTVDSRAEIKLIDLENLFDSLSEQFILCLKKKNIVKPVRFSSEKEKQLFSFVINIPIATKNSTHIVDTLIQIQDNGKWNYYDPYREFEDLSYYQITLKDSLKAKLSNSFTLPGVEYFNEAEIRTIFSSELFKVIEHYNSL